MDLGLQTLDREFNLELGTRDLELSPPIPIPSRTPPPRPIPAHLLPVEQLAVRAEQRLNLWFDCTPQPPIDQLAVATQAIWRLAAVRKTLMVAAGHRFKPAKGSGRTIPPELARAMQELETLAAGLNPPRRPAPPAAATGGSAPTAAAAPGSSAAPAASPAPAASAPPAPLGPLRSPRVTSALRPLSLSSLLPRLPGLPASPPAPPRDASSRRDPKAPSPATPAHSHTPARTPGAPIALCPTLRAPLNTASAAARQVESLCKSSGVPPTPPSPQAPSAPALANPAASHPTPVSASPPRPNTARASAHLPAQCAAAPPGAARAPAPRRPPHPG